MSRRRGRGDEAGAAGGLPPIYEGPEALEALLVRAGSSVTGEEVIARFTRAVAQKEARSAVIPGLFTEEPRFASPEEARRLYGNLFGLWARLEAGLGAHDDAPDVVPEPPPPAPLPERGMTPGTALPADLVEAIWKHLAAAPPREVARRRDRFANLQPDLAAWLDDVPLPDSGALATTDLAFEAWSMFDQGFGERLVAADWRALKRLEREPPPLTATQPALAAYVAEALDTLEGEDDAFDPAARAQVEKVVATLVAALTAALRQPS
ncbi:MAG: hypothetical protein IPO09_13440 [Anaeromyxobacter sp.]|nr:hypothetical protein [Anaeromyxobacter sp.]